MKVVFDKSVNLKEVEAAVEQRYAEWRIKEVNSMGLWRVLPERFVVSVDFNEGGYVQVMYIPFVHTTGRGALRNTETTETRD
jgi:hypothetical protein